MDASDSPDKQKANIKPNDKSTITTVLKWCLGVLIISFVVIVILLMVIPAGTWSIRVISGSISTSDDFNLTIENVITYAISMLSLLVTVITLGVGFIAVFGYHQIKTDAHDTAEKTAKDVATSSAETILKDTKTRVDILVGELLAKAENERHAKDAEGAKLNEEFGTTISNIIKKIYSTQKDLDTRVTPKEQDESSTSCDDSAILSSQGAVDDVTDNELK